MELLKALTVRVYSTINKTYLSVIINIFTPTRNKTYLNHIETSLFMLVIVIIMNHLDLIYKEYI